MIIIEYISKANLYQVIKEIHKIKCILAKVFNFNFDEAKQWKNIKHLQLVALHVFFHLIPMITLWGTYYYLHFPDGETEAQQS